MIPVEIRPARYDELAAVRDLFVEVVRDLAVYNQRARTAEIGKHSLQHLEALHREDRATSWSRSVRAAWTRSRSAVTTTSCSGCPGSE